MAWDRFAGTPRGERPLLLDSNSREKAMLKFTPLAVAALALIACAPSDQADSGDSTFAPSNTTSGTVPDGIPGESAGSARTDGETSTRGAVTAADSPTSAPGSSATGSAAQGGSGR
ncbi:hypothetical protein [Sphingobium bisphenolivorans]|uniref:hypothetical protein n=1 Tax=Sphingobium bisphenolivorans TaxID=1335760 RepID=UPI0003A0CD38|nr:hypothetical protein [Sphingobium bisphenolivorans]